MFCEEFERFVAICLSYSTFYQTMVWICSLYWLFLSSLVCINFVIRSRTLPNFFYFHLHSAKNSVSFVLNTQKSQFLSFHFILHNQSNSTLTKFTERKLSIFCVFFRSLLPIFLSVLIQALILCVRWLSWSVFLRTIWNLALN